MSKDDEEGGATEGRGQGEKAAEGSKTEAPLSAEPISNGRSAVAGAAAGESPSRMDGGRVDSGGSAVDWDDEADTDNWSSGELPANWASAPVGEGDDEVEYPGSDPLENGDGEEVGESERMDAAGEAQAEAGGGEKVGGTDGAGSRLSISVDVEGLTNDGDNTIIGMLVQQDQSEKYALETVSQRTVQKLERVYIRPASLEGLDPALEALSGRAIAEVAGFDDDSGGCRVLVVHGAEHAGKLASVLAMTRRELVERGAQVLIYRRKAHESGSLLDVVRSKQFANRTVVVLRDAFDKNVALGELAGAELDQLTEVLSTKESFLVITTELNEESLRVVGAPKVLIEVDPSQQREILAKHLAFYSARGLEGAGDPGHRTQQIEDAALSIWRQLQDFLTTPFHIDRFCEQVQELASLDATSLERLARSIGQVDPKAMRLWFESLASNEKLLALLVYLFDGLNSGALEELTTEVVFRLRAEGFLWVEDPREMGFRSLLETIRAGGEQGEVEFEDTAVQEEVAWQTGNRRALLWSALEPIIAETAAGSRREDPVRRAALGTAVGRMGINDRQKLNRALDRWARGRGALERRQGDAVASLAGVAMAEALRRQPAKLAREVVAKLKNWIASRDPDLIWAAGAAAWRIYHVALARGTEAWAPAVRNAVRLQLRQMVRVPAAREEIRKEIRACAAYALEKIGRADLSEMVAIQLEWLKDRELQQVRRVVFLAAQRTFDDMAELGVEPRREKYRPLLLLIGAVFANSSGGSKTCRSLCRWLAAWLKWEEWRVLISEALLAVANHGSDRARAALREALSRWWLAGPDPAAEAIAHGLIARAHAMDGTLSDLPALGRGLLVLDPALFEARVASGQAETPAEAAARRRGNLAQVREAMETQMETVTVLLGAARDDGRDDQDPIGGPHPEDAASHRLLTPAIDRLTGKGVAIAVVMTGGPILDLEDALDSLGGGRKVVVAAGCEIDPPAGVAVVHIGPEIAVRDVEKVETELHTLCAQALVELPPPTWRRLLEQLGIEAAELAAPEESLEGWVDRLAEPDMASGRTDLARRILGTVFWLAAGDFERCLRLARRWLTEEEPAAGLRRAMGLAIGKALFRAAAHVGFADGRWLPLRLFDELARPLADASQDGTTTVLRTVERWLAVPELAAGLAGEVEDGRGRLLRWADDLAPQKVGALQAALDRFGGAMERDDLGVVGEAVDSMVDRLRVRWSVGRPRRLPSLEEGQRYGVVVFDPAVAGRQD